MSPSELKAIRRELGLSQSDLAEMLGLTGEHRDKTVRRWESGEIDVPATVAMLLTLIREAMATYRLTLAEYGRPGAVALAKKRSGPEKAATEAVAALLGKAGIKVEII